MYSVAVSMKVALGSGNCALRSYCLVVTQANHCSELGIPIAQISNDQLPKQPFTGGNHGIASNTPRAQFRHRASVVPNLIQELSLTKARQKRSV